MSNWMFLKVFGDLCLYFSVVAGFPGLFAHSFSFLLPCVLCAAAVSMSTILTLWGRGRLRFLALLLPLACFALASSVMECMILLPAIVYICSAIVLDRMSAEYYSYRRFYLNSLIIWCVFFVFLTFFTYIESISLPREPNLAYGETMRYGILYMVNGVILLRLLRMGDSGDKANAVNRRQLALIMLSTGGLLIGALLLERYLVERASSLAQKLWEMLMVAIVTPFHLLGALIVSLLPKENKGDQEVVEQFFETANETLMAPIPTEVVEQMAAPKDDTFPWWLACMILLILLGVLVLMLKTFRKRRQVMVTKETVSYVTPPKRVKTARRRSSRDRVRQVYREFLRSERKKGLRLNTNQTSRDILDHLPPVTDKAGAEDLREVYHQARYNPNGEITPAQVDQAKKAYKRSQNRD